MENNQNDQAQEGLQAETSQASTEEEVGQLPQIPPAQHNNVKIFLAVAVLGFL